MLTAILIGLLAGSGVSALILPRLHRRWLRLSAHRRLGLLAPPARRALPEMTLHELAERIEYPERYGLPAAYHPAPSRLAGFDHYTFEVPRRLGRPSEATVEVRNVSDLGPPRPRPPLDRRG
jgi:hypothetical protein